MCRFCELSPSLAGNPSRRRDRAFRRAGAREGHGSATAPIRTLPRFSRRRPGAPLISAGPVFALCFRVTWGGWRTGYVDVMVNPFRPRGRRSVRPIVSRGPRIHFLRNPRSTTQHGAKPSAFLRRVALAACVLGTALVPIPARAQGVYVASAGSDSVTAIDGTTMTVIGKPVPVGAAPSVLAVTPDGKTVIATVLTAKDGQRVVVIDAVRNQRQRFLKPFGPPIAVSVEPTPRSGGRLLFEVLVRDGPFGPGISFFNLKRMAWIHFTRGRRNSSLLAVTPDGARIYVPGTDRKTGTAFLSEFHFFFTAGQSHTGLRHDIDLAGGAISALGITPDSRFVIVATQDPSGGIVNVVDRANNNQVTSSGLGSGVLPENLAIGHNAGGSFGLLTTNQVLVRLSSSGNLGTITSNATLFPGHFTPSKVALTPNGAVAYLTDGAQPFVARLDVPGGGGFGGVQMVRLPNATTPAALAVSPDGHSVFVAQGDPTTGGGVVSRIDVSSNAVTSVAVEGQPVALAAGAKNTASLDKARLIRQTQAGREDIPVPLKEIVTTKKPDMPMLPDDILFIPDSTAQRAGLRALETAISLGTGVVIWRR